jgi:hypothetical protein
MKHLFKHVSLAPLLVSLSAFAQPIVSPEVQANGRVTFRLSAPNATNVQIQCEGIKKAAMQKDASIGVHSG